jgi:hypothetical protein
LNRRSGRAVGAWLTACAFVLVALYPLLVTEVARQRTAAQARRLQAAAARHGGSRLPLDGSLSLRVARLDGLLSSWETVGGCGAGSSTGAGGGIKWIGRSATGGLFQLQSLATYTHLHDGYNLALSTQITRDLGEKWNVGLAVPLLYKYYRDYYGLPVDISNSGVGDVAAMLTRRFGEINNTSLSLLVGFPTGTYKAQYKNDYLTQEKQLGAGKVTASLTLDHTMDETWGVIVVGASGAWRGGQNELANYRAPVASVYSYAGYFAGPWVPSLGLSATRFFGVDRDRGLDQLVQLMAVTGTFSIEWSTDWLAILAGVSLPYGWETHGSVQGGENSNTPPGLQPWTIGLGFTISPF